MCPDVLSVDSTLDYLTPLLLGLLREAAALIDRNLELESRQTGERRPKGLLGDFEKREHR